MVEELNGATGNDKTPSPKSPLRIFLAAPPDVSEERTVVQGLIREFEDDNLLELVTWGDELMPADCDAAVFILWSRMDATLPAKTLADEEWHERSSFELAYENAAARSMDRGRPDIWMYRRTQAPSVRLDAPDIDDRLAQWRKVEWFVGELRKAPAVPNLFNYDTLAEFRTDFTQRLKHWVGRWRERRRAIHGEYLAPQLLTKPEKTLVQFTAYYPKEVLPRETYDLLAYAHWPWVRDAVEHDSRERLKGGERHRRVEGDAESLVQHGAEIVVVPELQGFGCNPPEQRILWLGDWHRTEFKIWANPSDPSFSPDSAINGSLSFYIETVLIAKLPLSIFISGSQAGLEAAAPPSEVSCSPYASIFVSYSREDEAVVDRITRAIATIGATVLRDRDRLKSGQNWHAELLRLIESADIFQLYWSAAAKRSKYVAQEWRHALAQPKSEFVHPFYWRCPLPKPPRELQSIHFHYYPLDMEPGFIDRPAMVIMEAGSFYMGSKEGIPWGRPAHTVTINHPFAIGKYPVTFEEYDRFVRATGHERPRDAGWGRECRPVINVSWHDAKAYCKWLSEQTGEDYRLPTEAEWEYAARAGTDTPWFWGESEEEADRYAWFYGRNKPWMTQPVGKKEANPWGLYDIVGNVWEWVEDCWHNNYEGAPTDGSAWESDDAGAGRVIRGGSWLYYARRCRSAFRDGFDPDFRFIFLGFRCARVQES